MSHIGWLCSSRVTSPKEGPISIKFLSPTYEGFRKHGSVASITIWSQVFHSHGRRIVSEARPLRMCTLVMANRNVILKCVRAVCSCGIVGLSLFTPKPIFQTAHDWSIRIQDPALNGSCRPRYARRHDSHVSAALSRVHPMYAT